MKTFITKLTLLMAMLVASLTVPAYGFEVDGICYNILSEEDKTVEVTFYFDKHKPYSGKIDIPSSVVYDSKTYAVTTIGHSAFQDCNSLTSVTIPNSVTSIGERVFYGCTALTSVTIPNSVTTLGVGAFACCRRLISVTIPNSVTTIGEAAFSNCSNLISVTIPNSVTSIEDGAFAYCYYLTSVTIPNSVTTIGDQAFKGCTSLTSVTIPNSVTTIGAGAFYDCKGLTSVTIPNSVTYIGASVFLYCDGLTSVTIGNGVTSIGDSAFQNCGNLITIFVDENNPSYRSIDGILYNKDATILIACPGKKESVTIPNSVTTIGDYAFAYCTSLTSVTIPNSVTTIGDWAFKGCIGLTSVTLPNSVTTIGKYAFQCCSSLTSVTIPNSVTTIGDYAFQYSDALTSIFCQATTPPKAGNCSFSETALKNCKLYIPKGCKADYEKVDPWRNFWNIEEMDFGGVDDVTSDTNADLQFKVENGAITVNGISDDDTIVVYDAQGRVVYSGTEHTITNLARGIYIIKVGTATAKVSL